MKKYLIVIIAPLFLVTACKDGDKKINLNQGASFMATDTLPENPLLEKVLTVSVNTKDSTMSTLYANKIAVEYATTHGDKKFPPGAVLYQVTWKQKADSVWFGARIPKEIQSIERIFYTSNSPAVYELYEGRPLRRSNMQPDPGRIASIVEQRLAISPYF
ncbi:hypothetical protein A4D02_11290 [Niastella koreensis]|uniref:Lipoprotein n=2 Tax=Niastella koreensis TaxID=354356 RepID=G8T9F1_NIAKG|nr:hypothetical protein [Niastella koreensis]AEV99141.1 hypothetical protein Niako_2807 [Niastella koreensis GR20-10]OQP44045.1 hypothetical protein A4D02_11290 [Niastella koreensis]